MRFRKKPVEIEAFKTSEVMHAAKLDWKALPPSISLAYEEGGWVFTPDGIHIKTLEGTMIARPDDWIIKGIKGEFYPCKPDIFEATYEVAE